MLGHAFVFVLLVVSTAEAGSNVASGAESGRDTTVSRTARRVVRGTDSPVRAATDSLRGRSGSLFMRLVASHGPSAAKQAFANWFGEASLSRPGVYPVGDTAIAKPFSFVQLWPFGTKKADRIGEYRLGFWPGERRRSVATAYENPEGFIEVKPENVDVRVSEHFRLGDFLTHDQAAVWPKYLVLREDLIDKLELVISELQRTGIAVQHMAVMSGFRTPRYNAHGGETGGRSALSRHMYGDAADVFVDNDGDGRMDDLNHDGRIDSKDARIIAAATERVEREHDDLVGGAGVYRATRSHGPFAHIDVRGRYARWGVR